MNKESRINVRTTEEIKRELEITAKLRGLRPSSLVNLLVAKAIREEKLLSPEAFSEAGRAGEDRGSVPEDVPSWQQNMRRVKGMWKDRQDLPDFDLLRREADRNERWEED